MLKREFVRRLAQRFPDFSASMVSNMVEGTFTAIMEEVAADGRVEIRGFGVFFLRRRENYFSRNPSTGEVIEVAAKKTPRFRAGKRLCEMVNR